MGLVIALLGLLALGAGIYLVFTSSLIAGIILVVVGLLILGGGFHSGHYGSRRPL